MSIKTRLLSAATAAALLTAPAALADETGDRSVVLIEQVQLDTTWSNLDVHVSEYSADALTTSTAVGNTAAGLLNHGDIDYDAFQTNTANVGASNQLSGGQVGNAASVTTAYGNASTAGTWGGNSFYRAEQDMSGDTSAYTRIDLGAADNVAAATTAAANVSVSAAEYGDDRAFQIQNSAGNVYAETDADLCCTSTSGVFLTTASGNVASSSGLTSTAINGAVQTTASDKSIHAVSDVYMGDGNDIVAQATASGNSYVLANQWGYTSLGRDGSELYQKNDSSITSESYVTLDSWSGQAASTAYGVGNSALVSGQGSDTALFAYQENNGQVNTTASLSGQSWSGGAGIANATSIGNAASAFLCNTCGDAILSGSVSQVNNASVSATTYVDTPYAGTVIGAASAIGNSATFQSSGD